MAEPPDGANMAVVSRLVAFSVVLVVAGAPLLAVDRASDARAAMPCCEADPCGQEIGQARECCTVSPAVPDERPALKVERAAPPLPLLSPVVTTLPSPAGLSRVAAVSAAPLDTSPSRPVVLRL